MPTCVFFHCNGDFHQRMLTVLYLKYTRILLIVFAEKNILQLAGL